jgi:hypothetical protein
MNVSLVFKEPHQAQRPWLAPGSAGCAGAERGEDAARYRPGGEHRAGPVYPRLTLTTTSLAVQAVPGTRMVVYRPADQVTREAIARLMSGEGAGTHYPCWEAHQQRKAGLAS